MRLLIVCRAFNNMAGGIEKMAAALMNEMCARGHDISLLTWDQSEAKSFYEFSPKIKWYTLDLGTHKNKAGWSLRLKRAIKLRAFLKEISPDVILAFQHGTFLSTRLYSLGFDIPVVAAERESPARFEHLRAGKWQHLIYQSFRLAKRVTIQCESFRNGYPFYLRDKIVTIPNPVFPANSFASPKGEKVKRKTLLSIGRLGYQKNHDVLVRAFSEISYEFPTWDLLIVGEGGDRESLMTTIKSLGLLHRVSLPGTIANTESLYCKSHLFCLSARWEGFPNVVSESLSHGLPVIGFRGCSGTRDLIKDKKNGLLAQGNNDAESLAKTLRVLMKDGDLREKMGREGIDSMKKFSPDHVFDMWENFLEEVSKE